MTTLVIALDGEGSYTHVAVMEITFTAFRVVGPGFIFNVSPPGVPSMSRYALDTHTVLKFSDLFIFTVRIQNTFSRGVRYKHNVAGHQ